MRRWHVITAFGLSDPYPTATAAHDAGDPLGMPVVARDDEDQDGADIGCDETRKLLGGQTR